MFVAAAATAMLDRLIILPITPPAELADAISTGLKPELGSSDHLQIAEQRVGGSIGAGEEHAQPAENRAEERKRRAGGRERQPQRSRWRPSSSSGTPSRARRPA